MQANLPSTRKGQILQWLRSEGLARPAALAARLGVSVQTIRTDLRALEEEGRIRRRHGSISLPPDGETIGYDGRSQIGAAEKARIAARVAALIPQGARIALGTGTTVAAVAKALTRHRGLQVFTGNLHAALALREAPGVSLTLAGGALRLRDLDLTGPEAAEFFARLRVDHAVYSVGGISAAGDLLDYSMDEIRARRALHDCAASRILVADSGKFGRSAAHAFGRLSSAETFVTGAALSPPLRDDCRCAGCEVLLV